MIGNYIKIAFRNIMRHKGYSFINIAGLAIGMACCILILLWVQDELSYDGFHAKADYIYRVLEGYQSEGEIEYSGLTSARLGPALKQVCPETVAATRWLDRGEQLVRYDGVRYEGNLVALADPDFLQMFTFPLVQGDANTALSDKFSVVITERMKQRVFGDGDAVGQILSVDGRDFTVTGVMRDIPANSHLQFDCLSPFASMTEQLQKATDNWLVSAFTTYIQLRPDARASDVSGKLVGLLEPLGTPYGGELVLGLQPLREIYLDREIVEPAATRQGDLKYIYLFSALAALILIIACVNYINLMTARSAARAAEVGVRKVAGAGRIDLIKQFLGESLAFSVFALLAALIIVELCLPAFSAWCGKQLSLNILDNQQLLLGLGCIVFFTGLIAGSYPAFRLASFAPARSLKGVMSSAGSRSYLRRTLVTVQFALSIFLIVVSLVIFNQLNYVENRDLGFAPEQLMYFRMHGEFQQNYFRLKQELLRHPAILAVTAGRPPIRNFNPASSVSWGVHAPGETINWLGLAVDDNYIRTYQMEIVTGRDFAAEISSDAGAGFIINETAAGMMGTENPIGQQLSFETYDRQLNTIPREGMIVGVVRDFHYGSLHTRVSPLVMYQDPDELAYMSVRVDGAQTAAAVNVLRETWDNLAPEYSLEYHFVDQTIERFYRSERRLGTILGLCTVLAIFVSCLGLFGLATFAAERRTREIGIRKVLGVSIPGVVRLITTEFVLLVALGGVLAGLPAYYVMSHWLEDFAYRTEIGPGPFILATVLALATALVTVSYQAIRAAVANPVNALRHE